MWIRAARLRLFQYALGMYPLQTHTVHASVSELDLQSTPRRTLMDAIIILGLSLAIASLFTLAVLPRPERRGRQ